jgi:peptidoglycan/xylan/chitin deacetylase (PgdA/CDA1 family)
MQFNKKFIKSYITDFINDIGFIKTFYSGLGTVLMLHRVYPLENNKLAPNERLKVSPEFLEQFIIKLKKENYDFISLDDLYIILKNGEKAKKKIVFTLDDGYADNYEIAYSIFKKHNIPFTIYITTSFPDQKAILWWYLLEDLIIENEEIVLSDDRKFSCKTEEEKIDTFNKIRKLIQSLKRDDFLNNLQKLFKKYDIDWLEKSKTLCLNWEQIVKLSKDELVTIGGHTVNHLALNQLSEDEVINEVLEANRIIESKINKKIEHFAYPFGSRSEIMQREFDIVKNLHFKTVTTTRKGNIFSEHANYLECLPRLSLNDHFNMREIGKIKRTRVVTL